MVIIEVNKTEMSVNFSKCFKMEYVAGIKSLPERKFDGKSKKWVVPVTYINEVLTVFKDAPVTIESPAFSGIKQIETKEVAVTDFDFKTKPFDHQLEGFQYAQEQPKFLLGDEQGLGKTKQAIDIAVSRKDQFKHCLIVCGVNSLKFNWIREVGIHSNEQGIILGSKLGKNGKLKEGSIKDRLKHLESNIEEFFLITNIETLRSKKVAEKLQELCESGVIGMTVIDEIHKCKNPQSQQGKAIHSLKTVYKMAMTGTPLMNQPLDLYNVLKWLDVETHSFYAFRNRYCVMGGFQGYEVVGYKNMAELRGRVEDNMLRRKKEEVLNLPPKIRSTEYLSMTAEQEELYKVIEQELIDKIDEIVLSPNPLAMLTRLRQVTGHPAILSDNFKSSAKIERMKELVEELAANGQKAVIFSNWEEMTKRAKKELAQYNPAYITGSTKDRAAEVDKFQTDDSCQVIIGTIGAMGTGLTLTAGSYVIFLDKAWTMANVEQAEDRCHRIGTKNTVHIITLACKDTVDERIEEILATKKGLSDALIDGQMDKLSKQNLIETLLS